MKRFKLIIFDLDGTLADTSEGIFNAHKYATKAVHYTLKADDLNGVIGDSLLHVYRDRFGLPEETARNAIQQYRAWYAEEGRFQASLYPGMKEALAALCQAGFVLAVATLKLEAFAQQMLEELGIASYFCAICGVDENDNRGKSDIINLAIQRSGLTKEAAVLVGDSVNDAKGAQESGIAFIGCVYGFGYRREREVVLDGGIGAINSVEELQKLLSSEDCDGQCNCSGL